MTTLRRVMLAESRHCFKRYEHLEKGVQHLNMYDPEVDSFIYYTVCAECGGFIGFSLSTAEYRDELRRKEKGWR